MTETNQSQIHKQVQEFMRAGEQEMPETPTIPTPEILSLRVKLILEETFELVFACFPIGPERAAISEQLENICDPRFFDPDMVEIADALGDLDYVVEGMRLALGIDGSTIANEIHKNNMTKFGPGSWVNADGKQMKPPNWTPPDIAKLLKEQGWHGGK